MNVSCRRADPVRSIISILALVTSGCAYFNTFYNAQAHFDKAQRIESTREADSGVSGGAVTEYDLTIEKCNKVIQRHKDSRWVDDAILLMGRAYYGKRQFPEALEKFRALADYPESNLQADALYWAGAAYYELARVEEGRQAFERLLREFPRSERRAEVLRVQAKALVRAGQPRDALASYRRLLEEFPDPDERVDDLFDVGELYMELGAFDSAYAAYDRVVRTADRFDVRLDARVLRGDALFRERRYGEALDTYRTALDVGQSLPVDKRAVIELKAASCRTELGEFEKAISEYTAIAESYHESVHAAEALFKIGFIQETRFGDYQTALASYESVKQLPGVSGRSLFSQQAEERARELRRLVEAGLTSRAAGGSENTEAKGAFLLAEQFLFQEEDTTKALVQYRKVEDLFPATEEAARAAFAKAWLVQSATADSDSVNAEYVHIVETYPGTVQARGAGQYLIARGLGHLVPKGAMELKERTPEKPAPGAAEAARTAQTPNEQPEGPVPGSATNEVDPAEGDPYAILRSRAARDPRLHLPGVEPPDTSLVPPASAPDTTHVPPDTAVAPPDTTAPPDTVGAPPDTALTDPDPNGSSPKENDPR